MFFRSLFLIDEPMIANYGNIVLHAGAAQKVAVTIRPMDDAERGKFDKGNCWLAVPQVERNPREIIKTALLAHAARVAEVLAGRAPPIPGDQIPEDLLVYSDQIGADLHDASTRVLQVMRWRLNLRGRHNPIRATKGSYFSSDNGTWHPLPMSSQVSVDSFTKPDITPAVLLQLPTLPARMDGQPVVIPKAVLDQMKKAVQIRNQLAHAGHPKIDGDFLHEVLRQARQLLWLFDAMTGHRWAAAYLRGEGGL